MPSTNSNAVVPIEHFPGSSTPAPALVPDIEEVPCDDHSCRLVHDVLQVKKSSRRPNFTLHNDVIIALEVRKFRAHVAHFGEVHATFVEAAQHANENKNLSMRLTVKSIQDRYKKIQYDNCNGHTRSRRMSGIGEDHTGGDEGELYNLSAEMVHARTDLYKKKKAEKTSKDQRENKKEEAGQRIIEMGSER